jgi:hypothetical protein
MEMLREVLVLWMVASVIVCSLISRARSIPSARASSETGRWDLAPHHPSLRLARVELSRPRRLR